MTKDEIRERIRTAIERTAHFSSDQVRELVDKIMEELDRK